MHTEYILAPCRDNCCPTHSDTSRIVKNYKTDTIQYLIMYTCTIHYTEQKYRILYSSRRVQYSVMYSGTSYFSATGATFLEVSFESIIISFISFIVVNRSNR